MVHKLYALKDTKSSFFNLPWSYMSEPEAVRNMHRLVNDPQTMVHAYPEDYDLYEIGTYDQQTGQICPLETPRHIVKATALKKQPEASKLQAVQ